MRPIYVANYLNIDSNDVFECTDTELLADWLDAIRLKIKTTDGYIERLKSEGRDIASKQAWQGFQGLLAGQIERRIDELEESRPRLNYWKDVCFGMTDAETFRSIERGEP